MAAVVTTATTRRSPNSAPVETAIEVHVPETITVAELAHKMSIKASEVIKALMKMGQMVTINQPLDQDTAMIVVEEMGHKAVVAALDDPEAFTDEDAGQDAELLPRARWSPSWATWTTARPRCWTTSAAPRWRLAKPVVSRSTSVPTTWKPARHGVVPRYPGHEAFTAMRAAVRRPPTSSFWWWRPTTASCPRPRKPSSTPRRLVPIVVAITKADKPDANPPRQAELVVEEVVPEEYGGDSPFVPCVLQDRYGHRRAAGAGAAASRSAGTQGACQKPWPRAW